MLDSPILFTNLLLWTVSFFDYTPQGDRLPSEWRDRPFVTWPCQDRELVRMDRCAREGRSLRGVKSREMGWTWLFLAMVKHRFLLFEKTHCLVISRKEEEVWRKGDPDTLFEKIKHDCNAKRIPSWLTDRIEEGKLIFHNKATGSTIAGESTNQDVGRSGRADLVAIDEAAAIEGLDSILQSLKDTGGSIFAISTPKTGSGFNSLNASIGYEQARMPWWEHPGKGAGRRWVERDSEDWRRLKSEHGQHRIFKSSRPGHWFSPWYERQLHDRSPRQVAEEIDMDEGGAGDLVFPPETIAYAREHTVRPPRYVGDLLFAAHREDDGSRRATSEPERLVEADDRLRKRDWRQIRFEDGRGYGPWRLWCELEEDPLTGLARPPQDRLYVIGADPGDGRMSANSAIVVLDEYGEQMAEWTSGDYGARDQGRIMVAAAIWFGGPSPALINGETNGVGGSARDVVCHILKWPRNYQRRLTQAKFERKTSHLWFGSTRTTKREALYAYADMLSSGDVKIYSEPHIREAATYVIKESGAVVQATLADEATAASDAHGDRAMAGACAVMAMRDLGAHIKRDHALIRQAREDPMTPLGRDTAHRRALAEKRRKRRGWRI